MTWTGGTIGSQTNGPSTLMVWPNIGSTSTIGANNATETLGDNLVNMGDVLTPMQITGTNNKLLVTDNANITNNGSLLLAAGAQGITNASGSNGVLTNNGDLYADGATPQGTNLQCIPIVNASGGYFGVGDADGTATVLQIKGKNPQNGVSVLNNGGTTTIYTGSTLLASYGLTQQAGALQIAGSSGTATIQDITGAYGYGNTNTVVINGGTMGFSAPADDLTVGNNFLMSAGTLTIGVDATQLVQNSIGSQGGSITIANGSTITVNTVNIPAGGMPHQNWTVFTAPLDYWNTTTMGPLPPGNWQPAPGKPAGWFILQQTVTIGPQVVWNWNGFTYKTQGNNTGRFVLVS
jgi:hypothetical protein